MRTLVTSLSIFVLAYGLLVALIATQQHRLVYQPFGPLSANPSDVGLKYQDVSIRVSDQESIHGWFLPVAGATATVLFFHGNAGNISHRLETLRLFSELGLQTLIIDYRGYGQSDGSPGESASYEDAIAAWQWLVEQQLIDPSSLIIYGRSLGGGVASYLASQRVAGALVLDSTFLSMRQMAKDHYWWLPVDWTLRIYYNTASRLPDIEMPTLIFHSRDDEIVNYKHAEQLAKLARKLKQLIPLTGSHNTLVAFNRPVYLQHLKELKQTLSAID